MPTVYWGMRYYSWSNHYIIKLNFTITSSYCHTILNHINCHLFFWRFLIKFLKPGPKLKLEYILIGAFPAELGLNWSVNIVQMNRIWVANISNRCIWWSKNQFPFLDLNLISIAAKRILQEILILRYLQKYMYYATHRNPPTYRSTSNFASSVLRILEERAFAVGNYQSIIAITKIITVIVVIVIMLNDIPTSWELLAICLAFFPPSDTFFPYLLSFIQKVSGNL